MHAERDEPDVGGPVPDVRVGPGHQHRSDHLGWIAPMQEGDITERHRQRCDRRPGWRIGRDRSTELLETFTHHTRVYPARPGNRGRGRLEILPGRELSHRWV